MNVCYILGARGRNRVIASPRDVGTGGLITSIVGKFKTAPESYGPRCGAFWSER